MAFRLAKHRFHVQASDDAAIKSLPRICTYASSVVSSCTKSLRPCSAQLECLTENLACSPIPQTMPTSQRPTSIFMAVLSLCTAAASLPAQAQTQTSTPPSSDPTLGEIVVSGSRSEQRRFDVPGAIDAVDVDPMRLGSPLVN